MAEPDRRGGAGGSRRRAGTEAIPPQNQVSGGPDTPLELGETGWRRIGRDTSAVIIYLRAERRATPVPAARIRHGVAGDALA